MFRNHSGISGADTQIFVNGRIGFSARVVPVKNRVQLWPCVRACLKIHSYHLHVPLCGKTIFKHALLLQHTLDIVLIFCKDICAKSAIMMAKYRSFTQVNFGMHAVITMVGTDNSFNRVYWLDYFQPNDAE